MSGCHAPTKTDARGAAFLRALPSGTTVYPTGRGHGCIGGFERLTHGQAREWEWVDLEARGAVPRRGADASFGAPPSDPEIGAPERVRCMSCGLGVPRVSERGIDALVGVLDRMGVDL